MARTMAEQSARVAWWKRHPWPVVILGVDPASEAGACITLPRPTPFSNELQVYAAAEVITSSREVEDFIYKACAVARNNGMQLVMAMEDWGSGGRLGIKTWLGMGAAAGAWERALRLAARETGTDVLVASRCVMRVQQVRWRSWCIEESGTRDGNGKYTPYDSDGWKAAATRTVRELYPKLTLPGTNAAEAVLVATYTARSDELGRMLPARLLKDFGMEPPLPDEKKPKRKKK